jgi:hypothetical protein
MLCALLFIVLQLCRPTFRIHSWSLQHTPARTYCSPSSCMRSKSQLRLPCQLISIILLTISSSFLILLIGEQLRLPCCLLVLYCSPAISSSFIILLIDEQLRLPCRLLVLLLTISSSCIMLLIIEQLRPPYQLIVLYCSSMSSSHIILLVIERPTLLLLGIRSLNILLAHSIAVNTSYRSFGYYKPGHTSPLLHQILLFGESEKSSLSPSTH